MKKNIINVEGLPVKFPCPIFTIEGKKMKKKCCKKFKKGKRCGKCPGGRDC